MKLDEYLEINCVLTGSRAIGFERYNSDYDYAVTQKHINEMKELGLIDITYTLRYAGKSYPNILENDYSIKFYNNNKEYNLIIYPTDACLEAIENITKAVSCIPEAEDKNIRNSIFEYLCSLLITAKVKGIPEIDLDDNIPF